MTTMTLVPPVSDRAARAHAQKNCLSIILAVASLVAPELSDAGRERIERLRSAAKRMSDLLEDDLDEIVGGEVTNDVDVEKLFTVVCGALRDRADAAHVALVVDCHGGQVRGSEPELREAVFNIVANALEATPPGRAVYVDADVTPEGGHLWTVHDSGEGMTREAVDKLGVPHRTSRPGGSGLGVALTRAVVTKLGGTLRFDSGLGRGTTATIWIPRDGKRTTIGAKL